MGNNNKIISENEETRFGFKVRNNRKKVWNIQLGILEEFKKICEKHHIMYYADGGTLLGAVRHKGYIPRDDDIDLAMFRKEYEKFIKIAQTELPKNIKIRQHYRGFLKLVNIETTALGEDNWWDKDYIGGINIDIFPIDYASKYRIINRIKSISIRFLRRIVLAQKSYITVNKMKKRKNFTKNMSNFIIKTCKINESKIQKIAEKISKGTIFKGNNIYSAYNTYRFFPEDIYFKHNIVNFENTTICIPTGYDKYLKIAYGDYMKPVIFPGGHQCRYSIDKSYKDIIKTFDRSKSNEENYKNCKDLFVLE